MKKFRGRMKHLLFAHKGNKYRPTLFVKESALAIILVFVLIEGTYQFQTKLVLNNTGFLASVLPAALTTLANADRASQGLSIVTEDPLLDKAAQAKAEDMAAKGYFAHVSPEGKTPWDWLKEVAYPYSYAGENLAVDFTDSVDVETAWMNSPMHRANILKKEYTRVGIGVAQGVYEGKQVTFVAQFFATRSDKSSASAGATKPPERDIATVPAIEIAETTEPSRVLGEQAPAHEATVQTPSESNQLAVVSTSPKHIVWYVLTIASVLFALLFALTLWVHARRRIFYLEVIGSGFAVLGIAAILIFYNGNMNEVAVPHDSQSANVASYL